MAKENERTVTRMAEYIEREAVYREICADNTMSGYEKAYCCEQIRNIHAADVAPVVYGQWEKWNGDDRHHCTVCECYANAERDSYGYIAYEFLDNFCPNCGAKMAICDLPAADVAPVRHGYWMEWFPGDCALIMTGEEMLYRCSCCDVKYSDVEGYKYCPNCGAKMDLEV